MSTVKSQGRPRFLLLTAISVAIGTSHHSAMAKDAAHAAAGPAYDEIIATAYLGLASWLDSIPEGDEPDFGFNDRDEFVLAEVGRPYRVYSIAPSGSVTPENRWRVPVSVDGVSRALLDVRQVQNGGIAIVSLGAAGLAGELDVLEAVHRAGKKNPAPTTKSIIRCYQRTADFVVFDHDPADVRSRASTRAYVVTSSRNALGNRSEGVRPFYGLHEIAGLLAE